MRHIIYKITFPNNTCYIGQSSKHEYERWGKHISQCSLGKHENRYVQNAYDKYGVDSWGFEVMHREESGDKKFVNEIERRMINKYSNCVNIKNTTTRIEMTLSEYTKSIQKSSYR